MEPFHATLAALRSPATRAAERFTPVLTALRRLRARLSAWRDEVAARPIDPNGWWR
jgi:hypothetical protein